jgi:hypothetical protein
MAAVRMVYRRSQHRFQANRGYRNALHDVRNRWSAARRIGVVILNRR